MTEGDQGRRSAARLRLRSGDRKRLKPSPKLREHEATKDANKLARLSVVTALVAAVLGAGVTVVVTLVTASNSRHQSAEEFQRNQQQTAYSDFIVAANSVDETGIDLYYGAMDPAVSLDKFSQLRTKMDQDRIILRQKLTVVQLVASDVTYQAAREILACGAGVQLEAEDTRGKAEGVPRPSYGQVVITPGSYSCDPAKMATNIDAFVKAARTDLNSHVS